MQYLYELTFGNYYYYGITSNPADRMSSHLEKGYIDQDTEMYQLMSCYDISEVTMKIIDEFDNDCEAAISEVKIISDYLGSENCLNKRAFSRVGNWYAWNRRSDDFVRIKRIGDTHG